MEIKMRQLSFILIQLANISNTSIQVYNGTASETAHVNIQTNMLKT